MIIYIPLCLNLEKKDGNFKNPVFIFWIFDSSDRSKLIINSQMIDSD